MLGLMQDFPLLVHRILDHAARWHGDTEVLSRSVEGPIHRITYAEVNRRARALASAAQKKLGVRPGMVAGTMAWNSWRQRQGRTLHPNKPARMGLRPRVQQLR